MCECGNVRYNCYACNIKLHGQLPPVDADKWEAFLGNVHEHVVKMENPSVRAAEIVSQHDIFDQQVRMSLEILESNGVPWNGQVPVL